MIIRNFNPFVGRHCETTAIGNLLKQAGIEFSEPMLFGLGEGLGFIYWKMNTMEFPFIGGRIKPDALTVNIAENLNLKLEVNETASLKKAWENVRNSIDNNVAVGLKLDSYYLEYFVHKIHFAGHYIAIYGYDDDYAYVVDSAIQGCGKTTLKNLELARNEKGPMSSKNLSYTIRKTNKKFNLKDSILAAVKNNARDYLNPPISNMGYKGILKTAGEIKNWLNMGKNIESGLSTTARLMEEGGTGGSLFRNLYKDFLKESYDLLKIRNLNEAYKWFTETAIQWKQVSDLLEKASETKEIQYINSASDILTNISAKEKTAMELLL